MLTRVGSQSGANSKMRSRLMRSPFEVSDSVRVGAQRPGCSVNACENIAILMTGQRLLHNFRHVLHIDPARQSEALPVSDDVVESSLGRKTRLTQALKRRLRPLSVELETETSQHGSQPA